MLFETSCPGHAESPEDEDEDGAEDEDDAEGERGKRDEEDGEIDEDDDALEELAVERFVLVPDNLRVCFCETF